MKSTTADELTAMKNIKIEDYAYDLPEDRIAKYPLENRDLSKLLVYGNGSIDESIFIDLPKYVNANTTMVYNNTKVIRARLLFHKETGAKIEIFCLEPLSSSNYQLAFEAKEKTNWKCIVGNSKKWKTGILSMPFFVKDKAYQLKAERLQSSDAVQEIQFTWNHPELNFSEVLEQTGRMPIPPYLRRDAEKNDLMTYQTVYSKHEGSVAAPTAGLHFTNRVFANLKSKGIQCEELTLHVGAGTFKPVKSTQIGNHDMHAEHIQISKRSLENLCSFSNKILGVGTTSVRSLESLYWMGVKILTNLPNPDFLGQWEAYCLPSHYTVNESFSAICNYMEKKETQVFNAVTQIMIVPGYCFKAIQGLLTNFHQPQSTLLLLIAALVGDDWQKIYKYALEHQFRFLSYGDSSLLMKNLDFKREE